MTATMPRPVSSRAASGVIWITAQKWSVRLLGFVTIVVLTRLLSPEDFGTVAAASTVLPFFFLLADLGFTAYIVQAEECSRRTLSTAFWFSLGSGILLAAVMAGLAPVLGTVFHDEGVVDVIRALSLWVILTAAGSVPLAVLRREMRFASIAWQGAVAAGIAQIVALVMAFSGAGAWTLVGQGLTAPVIVGILAWISVRWRPTLAFDRREFLTMAGFGWKVLGVEFVAMLRAWGEAAVITAVLGVTTFGFMTVAQRLIQVVQDLTGSAIAPVTQVAFAKIRDDADRLRAAYLRALRLTYFALSLPLTFFAVTAPLVVPLVFGDGWDPSYPVAQILALAGILTVGAWLDYGLFYGLGRPGAWFAYAIVIDGLTVATTAMLAPQGLVAVAAGFLVVCVVATITRWFLVAHTLQARRRVIAGPFAYVLVAVGFSGACGAGILALTAAFPSILSLLLVGVTVVIAHLVATRLVAPTLLRDTATIIARSPAGRALSKLHPDREEVGRDV